VKITITEARIFTAVIIFRRNRIDIISEKVTPSLAAKRLGPAFIMHGLILKASNAYCKILHNGLFSTPRKMRMAKSIVMSITTHLAEVKTTVKKAENITSELNRKRFSLI
jgi:hypothetical protein